MFKITLKNFRKCISLVKQKQAPFVFINEPITQLDARKKNFKMNKFIYFFILNFLLIKYILSEKFCKFFFYFIIRINKLIYILI